MSYTVDGHNRAKSKMLSEFDKAISDAAELREAATEVSGESVAVARAKCEEKSGSAGARPADASQAAVETAGETAAVADDCVHDSP